MSLGLWCLSVNTPYQTTLPTYPINTYPVNTYSRQMSLACGVCLTTHTIKHTLSMHPIHPRYQCTPSTYPINTPCQLTLSIPTLSIPTLDKCHWPVVFACQHTLSNTPYQCTLSNHAINAPYQLTYPINTYPINTYPRQMSLACGVRVCAGYGGCRARATSHPLQGSPVQCIQHTPIHKHIQ